MGARDAIAKLISGGIRAFHSSPHDFERFDLSKIGTGEGAQVYGHGIYAAENPAVSGQGGQYWNQFMSRMPSDEQAAAGVLRNEGFNRQKAIEYSNWNLDQLRQGAEKGELDPHMMKLYEARQRQHDLLTSGAPVGPRTYEVNIKADPSQFLDWDKPVQGQPVFASAAGSRNGLLRDVLSRTDTGENLYKALSYDTGLWKKGSEASKILAGEGIPGIKYLDEGSRISSPDQIQAIRENIAHREALLAERPGDPTNTKWLAEYQDMLKRAENPTSNYVVFDPANIDILKKYGIAGAAAAPVVGAAMGSTYDQGTYQEPDPMQGTYQ
jgi:hypothetical protein